MPHEQCFTERRKHQRFRALEGAVVLASSNFGNVINISKGGMAISYINWDNQKSGKGLMDVMLDAKVVLHDFPFTIIPDSETYNLGQSRMVVMKQQRIKFGSLTPAQEAQLDRYLSHHTFGEVSVFPQLFRSERA
ncbi:MAG: PilZ domain-containing protein [Thermodesulfobacteriota bacterium]|nr:PilZ domain-containing protein [Thermodesulfobacteriota bacterium]